MKITELIKKVIKHDDEVAELNSQLEHKANDTLKNNVNNMKSFINITNQAQNNYCHRNIPMLGDSHSWGQGSPNYQGVTLGTSTHCPLIHNDGMMDRLRRYMIEKFNSEPWRVIPFYDGSESLKNGDINSVECKNKETYTKTPKIIGGKYVVYNLPNEGVLYGGGKARNNTYFKSEYQYNAEVGLFSSEVAICGENDLNIQFNLETPTNFIVLSFNHSQSNGAKVKFELLDNSMGVPKKSSNGFGNDFYGTETPIVIRKGYSNNNELGNVVVNSDNIIIDTSYANDENNVYIIIFKQKKLGTVKLSYGGARDGISPFDGFTTPIIAFKGALIGNNDLIKNCSMGGHTLGSWLGEEGNWNDIETRNHLDDINQLFPRNFFNNLYYGAIIQVPIVNEYLKETSLANVKGRLTKVINKLNCGNVLLFSTIGQNSKEFPNQIPNSSGITYDQYYNIVKEWVDENKGNITYFDGRSYIKELIKNGTIKIEDCYDDDAHPSPMVNELLFEKLKLIVNNKF